MLVPELTYQYAQLKDLAGGSLLLLNRNATFSDSATAVGGTLYTVPNDKILIVSSITVLLLPGATQTAIRVGVSLGFEGTALLRGPEIANAVADTIIMVNWSGAAWIAPGEPLLTTGVFDAGANSNRVDLDLIGALVPRGNVQQG